MKLMATHLTECRDTCPCHVNYSIIGRCTIFIHYGQSRLTIDANISTGQELNEFTVVLLETFKTENAAPQALHRESSTHRLCSFWKTANRCQLIAACVTKRFCMLQIFPGFVIVCARLTNGLCVFFVKWRHVVNTFYQSRERVCEVIG